MTPDVCLSARAALITAVFMLAIAAEEGLQATYDLVLWGMALTSWALFGYLLGWALLRLRVPTLRVSLWRWWIVLEPR